MNIPQEMCIKNTGVFPPGFCAPNLFGLGERLLPPGPAARLRPSSPLTQANKPLRPVGARRAAPGLVSGPHRRLAGGPVRVAALPRVVPASSSDYGGVSGGLSASVFLAGQLLRPWTPPCQKRGRGVSGLGAQLGGWKRVGGGEAGPRRRGGGASAAGRRGLGGRGVDSSGSGSSTNE